MCHTYFFLNASFWLKLCEKLDKSERKSCAYNFSLFLQWHILRSLTIPQRSQSSTAINVGSHAKEKFFVSRPGISTSNALPAKVPWRSFFLQAYELAPSNCSLIFFHPKNIVMYYFLWLPTMRVQMGSSSNEEESQNYLQSVMKKEHHLNVQASEWYGVGGRLSKVIYLVKNPFSWLLSGFDPGLIHTYLLPRSCVWCAWVTDIENNRLTRPEHLCGNSTARECTFFKEFYKENYYKTVGWLGKREAGMFHKAVLHRHPCLIYL